MERERKHASGAPAGPQAPEPSFAERARTLAHVSRIGSLSSISRKQPGYPFGSIMPYALDAHGQPLFLISSMAMHTHNLAADPRASLLVTNADASGDALAASRVTLIGDVRLVAEDQLPDARSRYLASYENAKYWVDFEDFSFYGMTLIDVYYVGGFGVMGWVSASDYLSAEPDPLADSAAGILEHMNADHADSLILLARKHAGLEAQEARMTAVDRLGFNVRLKTAEGMKGARIPFLREVRDPRSTREVLVEMVQKAREP